MIARSKFCSLTLINWNGFFARTFELDELVTTLSGGNGAGKSTTMAAFVTALIPDLTLLHFRNTTEAGATTGSRDKGLYGKLKTGVCYAILEVINSRQQRFFCGVRLQQVAGRDRKVDIKPFILRQLPKEMTPIALVTELLENRQARILTLNELKARVETLHEAQFKSFNAITDYHAMMFDLGVIPKRLRCASDRSKFYRLIEASLYGGISSAITRSLRDYLLPENTGVRKAFQDMESALRENRMTLEAIKVTQADRNLFKHLIAEATDYVSADYMRHINERSVALQEVLKARQALHQLKKRLDNEQFKQREMAHELAEQSEAQHELEQNYQAANDQLNLVQAALRQQEKITRYQTDIDELHYRLEEQQEMVVQSEEKLAEQQLEVEQYEQEVDELKNQLADYQQALDVQQTQAIQYQQAQQTLIKAQELAALPSLSLDNIDHHLREQQRYEQQATDHLLALKQRFSVEAAAQEQFDKAWHLLGQLVGEVPRQSAWQQAQQVLKKWSQQQHQRAYLPTLARQRQELQQRQQEQQQAQQLFAQLNQHSPQAYALDQLADAENLIDQQIVLLEEAHEQRDEQRLTTRQAITNITQQINQLVAKIPAWIAAQQALEQLNQQLGISLTNSQQVTEQLQQLLQTERTLTVERDSIATQKQAIEQQIERLAQPCGAEDNRLLILAEKLGGVLLSEIYDDISLEDAPYFSALYGPARYAIVVPDLMLIRQQLEHLQDCPDDFYLIEGDPSAFDAALFSAEEISNAVIVKVNARQWRYSRFPETPRFGYAAREKQLMALRIQREQFAERYASLSFDLQKVQRHHQNISQFVGAHLALAFEEDPENKLKQRQTEQIALERELHQYDEQEQHYRQQLEQAREQLTLIHRLMPLLPLLADETLEERIHHIEDEYQQACAAADYLKQQTANLQALEPIAVVLQNDPQQQEDLQTAYQQAQQQQRHAQQVTFALTEVVQRRAYFSYSDAVKIVSQESELSETLRQRLAQAESARHQAREVMKRTQEQHQQVNQLYLSLKSAFDIKQTMLAELKLELPEMDVRLDEQAEEWAQQQKESLLQQVSQSRALCHQLEKQLTLGEAEIVNLQKHKQQAQRDYDQQRRQVTQAKIAWCNVIRRVKAFHLERRLHRRDFAYLDANELRSISDKALGALRLAVTDNELLRDALRRSEEGKHAEKKIDFYLAIYQHLRERIRQDIIRTDDPIEAIEQMEIELARLTEELSSREQLLAISAKSVANIIRKTIQREQTRIHLLNQHLQSVTFGQVKSVRLKVNVRETHANLLDVLAQQQEQHHDLFNSQRLTFSEALAKLYQRLNPHIDIGQRSPQTLGEELLDYRNYLDLDVEVFRGTEGWLRAESGALSTGEAIGTGMSILVMVVQSWEEESRRLRGNDIEPCRLLFLDEAARLDAHSIATLFELCDRLTMQLMIAAPENISPEKGTTYKLMRKVVAQQEYVHVVGLRGFAKAEKIEKGPSEPLSA